MVAALGSQNIDRASVGAQLIPWDLVFILSQQKSHFSSTQLALLSRFLFCAFHLLSSHLFSKLMIYHALLDSFIIDHFKAKNPEQP